MIIFYNQPYKVSSMCACGWCPDPLYQIVPPRWAAASASLKANIRRVQKPGHLASRVRTLGFSFQSLQWMEQAKVRLPPVPVLACLPHPPLLLLPYTTSLEGIPSTNSLYRIPVSRSASRKPVLKPRMGTLQISSLLRFHGSMGFGVDADHRNAGKQNLRKKYEQLKSTALSLLPSPYPRCHITKVQGLLQQHLQVSFF